MNHVQEPTIKDVFEVVEFIRDHASTKDDLQAVRTELKQDIKDTENVMITHVDSFVGMHKKLDLELTALRSKYTRLESHIQQIAKHMNIELV